MTTPQTDQSVPQRWDYAPLFDKAKYIAHCIRNGRLDFPAVVGQAGLEVLKESPSFFFSPFTDCLNKTGKLPAFTRPWFEFAWKNNRLPLDLKTLMQSKISSLPQEHQKLDNIF